MPQDRRVQARPELRDSNGDASIDSPAGSQVLAFPIADLDVTLEHHSCTGGEPEGLEESVLRHRTLVVEVAAHLVEVAEDLGLGRAALVDHLHFARVASLLVQL